MYSALRDFRFGCLGSVFRSRTDSMNGSSQDTISNSHEEDKGDDVSLNSNRMWASWYVAHSVMQAGFLVCAFEASVLSSQTLVRSKM